MKLEEYIKKRKQEDQINEFDMEKRMENTRICVNYVFEYYNNYLDTHPADEKTVLHEQKIEKYRKALSKHSPHVRDWLVSLYASHGRYMNRQMTNLIDDQLFLLYDSETEFRALSYQVYLQAVKDFEFLHGQSEMVFQFIKDLHRIRNTPRPYDRFCISNEIDEWIHETYDAAGVNMYRFCAEWGWYFHDHTDLWPKGHKKRSDYYEHRREYVSDINSFLLWDYDYKQKNNLFGLDTLYQRMPKKSFIRGRKQEIEATLMYWWLHRLTKDADYWQEYSHKVLEIGGNSCDHY